MSFLKNLKVSLKINLLILLSMISLLIVAVSGYKNMASINDSSDSMYQNNLMPIQWLGEMESSANRGNSDVFELMVTSDEAAKKALLKDLDDLTKTINQMVANYQGTVMDPFEKDTLDLFKETTTKYRAAREQVVELALANKDAEAYEIYQNKMAPLTAERSKQIDDLVSYNSTKADKINKANNSLFDRSRDITIGIVAVMLLIGLVLGYVIARSITKPLGRLLRVVQKVGEGDLREVPDVESKDEIGQLSASVKGMVTGLQTTVGGILESAESLSAAAQQISASSEEIAGSSTSQAHDAQVINELFRELSTAINAVARSAEEASELSDRTLATAQEGGTVVRDSIEGMNRINRSMSLLEDDSNKIGEIIEVIDDIADQTNLLALNAAIEAARAGEQGRGFAVVADEVRKLAERSSEATKQISAIIKGMQENTRASVKAVGVGTVASQETGKSFETIMRVVNETAHKVTEIAAACEEQAAQTGEVMKSVESISAGTEEAAAGCQETAATSQSLARLAMDLNRLVGVFKIR